MAMKKILAGSLAAIALTFAVSAADFAKTKVYENNFPDISDTEWYAADVKNTYELGLMNGDTSGNFIPEGNITVAEAITVASRAAAIAKGETIANADGKWYQMYVNYAVSAGIINADTFDASDFDRAAKRHEVASLFAKILPEADYAVINNVESVPDVTDARPYYDAVLKLYKAGIVMGSDAQGTFFPENNITRAEIAAIINRAAISGNRVQKNLDKVSTSDAYLLVTNRDMNGKEGINSGWVLDNRGGTPRTSATAVYGALFDIDENAGTQYIREFNKFSTGVVAIETSATIAGFDGVALEYCDENGTAIYKLVTVDGDWHVATPNGKTVKVYDIDEKNLTFSFKIEVDLDNARSTTFINGENVGTHPLTRSDNINLMSFRFTTDKEHTSVLNPGGVTMYVNYPIYGSVTTDGKTPYEKTFAPLGGDKVVSEFHIKTEKDQVSSYKVYSGANEVAVFTNDENAFYVNGEKVYENYYTTMYYRMYLELDMNAQTVNVKLNGRYVAKDIPFASATASVDRVTFESSVAKTVTRCKTYRVIEHDDYVPVPVKPAGEEKYNVGINVCSIWRNGYAPQGGWSIISPFDDRQPVLGYYDEGNPETADWEIKYLLEHGVDFQAFCVYFGNRASAEQLEAYHLYDGFMNAKYSDMTKFAIIWEAAGGQCPANMAVFKNSYVPYMIENFFKDPRYMTIDNKPVFIVYGHGSLKSALGGTEAVKEGLDYLEEELKKIGYDGAIFLCCNPESHPDFAAMGYDGCYAYNWGVGGNGININTSYMEKSANVEGSCYTVPLVSVGFNSLPWNGERYGMMSMDNFAYMHSWVKDTYLPKYAKEDWQKNFVMMSNWNEYGEGTYMMPVTDEKGFGYLDALREAYTDEKADESVNTVPTDAQKERITHMYPQYRRLLEKQSIVKEGINTEELISVGKVGAEAYAYTLEIGGFNIDKDGVMTGGSTGNDPVVMLQHVKKEYILEEIVAFELEIQVPKGSQIVVFYKTAAANSWNNARCVSFVSETDEMQKIMFSASNLPDWSGKFTGFRVDPCAKPGVEFTIKGIEMYKYSDKIPSRVVNINATKNLLTFLPFYSPKDNDLYIPFEPVTGIDYQLDLFHLWYKDEGVLKLYAGDHEIVYTVGKDTYTFDGKEQKLDMPLPEIDGIPYIPLNRLCKELGYTYMINDMKQVSIATGDNEYFVKKAEVMKNRVGKWEFDYAGDTEGWSSGAMSLVVSGDTMTCTSLGTGTDPIIMSKGGLDLDTSKYSRLEIKVKYKYTYEKPLSAQMFFITDKSGNWSEDKSFRFYLESTESGDDWEIYSVNLSDNKNWTGTVKQLRFDPFNAVGTMEVEYIRFLEA